MPRKKTQTSDKLIPPGALEQMRGGHGHSYRAGSVEDVAHLTLLWTALSMRRSGPGQLKTLAEEGATLPQIVAQHVLRFEGPCTMQHLVDQLGLTPSTNSHLVQRLVESGDAVRVEDELDRRQKRLSLTPQGIARTDQMMEARRDVARASIVLLSASTRQELAVVFRKVVSELTGKIKILFA